MDANDLLMSGGIKSIGWKDNPVGYTVVGTITDQPKAEQMKKYQSDELAFWPSGDPMMQIIVTIQTDLRDPSDANDDGKRRLHIPPRMMQPVREAVQRSGAKGLAIGGKLAVRRIGGTGATGDPFTFAAEYAAPAVSVDSLMSGNNATTETPSLGVTAAASPTAQSLGITGTTSTAAPATDAAPPGVDPTAWAGLPDTQKAAIKSAMGLPTF